MIRTDLKPDPRLYELFAEDREQAPRGKRPPWRGPTGRPAGRPRGEHLVYVGAENGGCKGCGVKMRRRTQPADEHPGAVVFGGYGLCGTCNEKRRAEAKR